MKELVKHLLDNNLESIVERSLLNCHCKGLHSIMLLESPGKSIRLYVAVPGNELYKNSPLLYTDGMSVGFHPHHCNLTLHCIKGQLLNWTLLDPEVVTPELTPGDRIQLRKYAYRSQITEGKQGFELINDSQEMISGDYVVVRAGESLSLAASDLHTVTCNPFDTTAWLVFEGAEDSNYASVCYSTSDLENINIEGLYGKPSVEQVVGFVLESGVLEW